MHEGTSKAHKYVEITVANAQNVDINPCSHFNLEFQGGAFLHLILTLTAISSRVAMLLTEEIRPAIEQSCQALHKLLHSALHVRGSRMNLCYFDTPPLVRSRSKSTILGGLFNCISSVSCCCCKRIAFCKNFGRRRNASEDIGCRRGYRHDCTYGIFYSHYCLDSPLSYSCDYEYSYHGIYIRELQNSCYAKYNR